MHIIQREKPSLRPLTVDSSANLPPWFSSAGGFNTANWKNRGTAKGRNTDNSKECWVKANRRQKNYRNLVQNVKGR